MAEGGVRDADPALWIYPAHDTLARKVEFNAERRAAIWALPDRTDLEWLLSLTDQRLGILRRALVHERLDKTARSVD
jgi:hypothetical protein